MSKILEDTSAGRVHCRNPNHSVDKHEEEPSCTYPSDMQEGKSGPPAAGTASCGCIPCEPLSACPLHDNEKFAPPTMPAAICPNCENNSGYTRRVGRDNDEIVENCPDHHPVNDVAEHYRIALEVIAETADKLAAKHDMSQPDHVADLHSLAEFARKKAAGL